MDKLKDECGIVAVSIPGNKEVANIAFYGLNGIQHRGQESAGLAVTNDGLISCFKDNGLVSEVFDDKILSLLKGEQCLGHVNHVNDGVTFSNNAQPFVINYTKGSLAVSFNGGLINGAELRAGMEKRGSVFTSKSDCETILHLIAQNSSDGNIVEAIFKAMSELKGGYAFGVMNETSVLGVRDPHGIRPLCVGEIKGGFIIASESCAIDLMGGKLIRDLEPGEIVKIENGSLQFFGGESKPRSSCVFEYVYFARPDSTIDGINVYQAREKAGRILAKESPAEADIVIGVPDSGTPAATGYAAASGIPYSASLIKNKYIGRTFIQPTQEKRKIGVKIKLNPIAEIIRGKHIALVDDSIVRGTTMRSLITIMKEFGALSVHLRISSPSVHHPCHFGVDTPDVEHLIANKMDKESLCKRLGADSLEYLSLGGLIESVGDKHKNFCTGCFNGAYPEF